MLRSEPMTNPRSSTKSEPRKTNHPMKKMMLMLLAVTALLLAPVGAAYATTPTTVEVTWLLPEGSIPVTYEDPRGDGFNVPESAYPQTLHEGAVTCERWAQIDTYTSEDAAQYTADGLLHYGEDWDGILAWRFVYGGTCPDPTPTATTGEDHGEGHESY